VHAMHTSQSGVSNNLAYLSHGQKADARVRSAQALQCAFTGRSRAWLMQRLQRSERVRDGSAAWTKQQSWLCCSSPEFCMCIADQRLCRCPLVL
jgi:predicted Zn-dependent protease